MQRARRRFLCSAGSLSSASNTSLRLRGRSRTSSAAGDSLAVNRELAYNALLDEVKPKLRAIKYNMRLLSSSHKNLKKPNRNKKPIRPPISSFQNAIVIAPFHTLKKCFQSKLVDLYSAEKMKKMSNKVKMAKKQNMSFEYDVLELGKVGSKVKTEKIGRRSIKRQKDRSLSYCQCDRGLKEKLAKEVVEHSIAPNFSSAGSKRRRLNTSLLKMNTLKAEIPGEQFQEIMSLGHSGDSWESYSNSPSNGGEPFEGTIAISTASFDSCFEKESCSYSNKRKSSRRLSREEKINTEYVRQPMSDSRHLIMNEGSKSSDGHIVDFMDREPHARDLSMELEQHLKPLRRQSKPKIKKPQTDYYLRSKSPSREKLYPAKSNTEVCADTRGSKGSSRKRSIQIEVATQVEDDVTEESKCEEEQQPSKNLSLTEPELTAEEKSDLEITSEQTILADTNEPIQIELVPSIEADVIVPSKEASEPQESDFIFGPRNMASRLGESCEFTFGLNWVFSDDETSEHGDQFY